MKALLLAVAALTAAATAIHAEMPPKCAAAEPLIAPDFALPRVAKAIADKKLDVLVVGAGSSTLPGAAARAYPTRLQAALAAKLPGVEVKVATDVMPRRTAIVALKSIVTGLAKHPALLVWQAGTIDAMRAVNLDDFSEALDSGIDAAHAAGADVILLNAQYSPRTESIIALAQYAEHMRWVGLRNDTPLFDRYNVMKLWSDTDTFDFTTHTKALDMAEQVHDCIGRLLAELVIKSAREAAPNDGR